MQMKVGYCQFKPEFGNVAHNLDRVARLLAKVRCDLMVLPELFASGYQFVSKAEVADLAEPIHGGRTTARLCEIARARRMHIVAGLPEEDAGRYYNAAVLVGPSGVLGSYRKTHLFFEETKFFAPGDSGFKVWNIGPTVIGVMVCFDWFYPEAARTLALQGADIICHPSNLVLPHCPASMPVRCLENRVFSITANRIGSERRGGKNRLTYIGQSEIVGPRGNILKRAPAKQEQVAVVEIDPKEARDKSLNKYNDLLRDRRPELYRA
ncbi:MAG: nitrilase-related carbon-nitrogen hydrolase [Nitrospira sp.]